MPGLTATLMLLLLAAAPADDDCLACHGDRQARSDASRSMYVDAQGHAASVHGGLSCTDCHEGIRELPHAQRLEKPACTSCHADAGAALQSSVHGPLGADACSGCHGAPHAVAPAAQPAGTQCASCHGDAVAAYRSSVHAAMGPEHDGAVCSSCHGAAHGLRAPDDPASPVAKRNLPATCGSCHADPEFLARHKVPVARPVEAYKLSVHGRAVERGQAAAAGCSDCHGAHDTLPARDARSRINRWAVGRTCGACHGQVEKTYADSVHGQATARGVRGAPVCTDCHGEHAILAPSEPGSLVNPARVSTVTCGHCHSDERLAARYNLPSDKVPAFRDSYHGLASRAGTQTVANCASCHGVHNILASGDPRSTIHPANLAATCGNCHPGAGERFAIGPVHVSPATASEHAVVRVIRVAYQWWIIPLTLAFMLLHHGADFVRKLVRREPRHETGEVLPRMTLHFRVAHWLVMASFPVLVVTGFALKFPEAGWAAPLLQWESGFGVRGTTHRVAGVVLVLALVYHAAHLLLSRRARRLLAGMLPRWRDLGDLRAALRWSFGRSPERARLPALSYVEKIEYWAFMWGTVIMAATGVLLWFNNWALRHLPTWALDAATVAHYYEAILATLAILVWHFYTVIFDPDVYPMDRAWLTGRTSADHLRHARPDHYHELMERRGREGKAEKEK